LRQRQEQRIRGDAAEFVGRVEWVSQLPQTFSGVVIANEVADALPVERFLIRDGNVLQARVELGRDAFAWRYDEAPALLEDGVRGIEADIGRQLEDGFESEISFALENWIADLATSLHEGLIFLIDYGVTRNEYYAAERSAGWLRCHFRHHAHDDPLILPGIQDLTAWVDFSAVAAAAAANGLDVAAYLTQAHFLINGGIEKELGGFTDLTVEQQVELSRQVKLLTLPAEMGENFKCMGLGRGEFDMPPALAGPDRAHRL
jgi:SAM-dependent MidA family methyltransferase